MMCIQSYFGLHRLYGADLHYHSTSMRNCVQKTGDVYNSGNMSNRNEDENLAHSSCQALNNVVASLTPALLSATGFTLYKVRGKVNKTMHPNQVHNYQVKSFLIQKLGEVSSFVHYQGKTNL